MQHIKIETYHKNEEEEPVHPVQMNICQSIIPVENTKPGYISLMRQEFQIGSKLRTSSPT